MGLSVESTRFLAKAKRAGVSFRRTLTLGRQAVLVSPEKLEQTLREHGVWPPRWGGNEFRDALKGTKWRFDVFAQALGAEDVASADASDYEGATFIHDLNEPIPGQWEEQYDAVIDGGTLEHVFNFPVAIANCMRWVKTGGHLILFTPANNYCGHGFYQFSPELWYRVLSPKNGYRVRSMVALADTVAMSRLAGIRYPFPVSGAWYTVQDPARIGRRVNLVNHEPSILMVLAQKIERTLLFAQMPQQSDFVTQWREGAIDPSRQTGAAQRLVDWLMKRVPESVLREVIPSLARFADPLRLLRFRRENSLKNRACYSKFQDSDIAP